MATATATKTAQTVAPTLLDTIMEIKRELSARVVNRSREIDALLTALIAGQHIFLLGTPGIGKSMLIDLLCQCLDAQDFSILMTKFTVLEDLYGPLSAKGLAEDRWEHQITGFLPTAQLAYLDEAWKCNGASLNALLWATNERKFRNGDKVFPIPLSTAFLASNELPENEALSAIYDRIGIRVEVPPSMDDGSFDRMMDMVIDGSTKPIDKPFVTWAQVEAAKLEASQIPFPAETRIKITELRRKLRDAGIDPTPRRWALSAPILRAVAWLDGAPQVETEHLADLANVLWDRPEQQGTVEGITLGLANPLQKKALEMLRAIEELGAEVERVSDVNKEAEMTPLAMEIRKKIKRSNGSLKQMEADVGQSRRQREIIRQCRQRLDDVTKKMLREVFDMTEEAVEEMVNKQRAEEDA